MLKYLVWAQCKVEQLKDNCKGVTAMEYGIIAAFTVAAVGASIVAVGGSLETVWTGIKTQLASAAGSA
ncbi:MAG TPA: Flp family type IVb pilin [Acetobacteraceae bacterium]|nr:Flp family type IVb pilin [Acetobacteraceae bacterium]